MTAEIIKLPYSVTRGAHSRKQRRSKNGTPEEREARLALAVERVRAAQQQATGAAFFQQLELYFDQQLSLGRPMDRIWASLIAAAKKQPDGV